MHIHQSLDIIMDRQIMFDIELAGKVITDKRRDKEQEIPYQHFFQGSLSFLREQDQRKKKSGQNKGFRSDIGCNPHQKSGKIKGGRFLILTILKKKIQAKKKE